MILSAFTFSFFSCDGGLFGSSDGIIIRAYDADSWHDTGILYANRGRSVFRTPNDTGSESHTYKITLSQGMYEHTKTVGGGTIVVMDNIPVGPWKITCRAYKSDGTLEYMGSVDVKVVANETVTASIELRKCPVVTFMDGENLFASQTVEFGGRVTKPENPTKTGFAFSGWYTEAEGGTKFDFENGIGENLTLYARWTIKGTDYQVMPTGTDGTAGTEWTYVLFGDWPQTIKADNVEIYDEVSVQVGMFTYYMGSDGNWYVRQQEKAYESGYKYTDGSTVKQSSANSDKYFKVEPIKWRVLTDNYSGKKLLLAENILAACQYYDNNLNRNGSIYPNNYKESRIRAYLNGLSYNIKSVTNGTQTANGDFVNKGFLQTAFNETFHSSIEDTTVDNSASSTSDTSGSVSEALPKYCCDDTIDKIFLLSEKEVTTSDYGFEGYRQSGVGNTRIRMTTDFAKASGAAQSTTAGYGGEWWLRSPSTADTPAARHVYEGGSAYSLGL